MSYTERMFDLLHQLRIKGHDAAKILALISELELRYDLLLKDERESLGK